MQPPSDGGSSASSEGVNVAAAAASGSASSVAEWITCEWTRPIDGGIVASVQSDCAETLFLPCSVSAQGSLPLKAGAPLRRPNGSLSACHRRVETILDARFPSQRPFVVSVPAKAHDEVRFGETPKCAFGRLYAVPQAKTASRGVRNHAAHSETRRQRPSENGRLLSTACCSGMDGQFATGGLRPAGSFVKNEGSITHNDPDD